ncbi:hypothetical protein CGCSCA4_v015023 [Colletotrichum siamense]|uniref:Uncharacterized protein n=1 Tax=Colletotrichum siamense TaxID=690259 RepID=A0A9P5EJ30_COLSI|nr:hypothetical protein CGCSCA4_v015023 [Colletotrichum siamense]KAF4843458.1 hypothetical protein CGCSCA2_v014246 [Colletotrichum siamense]
MPAVTRSKSSRRPSDSPPPGLQPTPRRRRRKSSITTNNKTEADSDNNNKTENEDDQTGQAIQLNLPLALPPPFNRQLLSLCFHASWRTRRRLRIHFSNRSEVLLDDDTSSSDSASSDPDSEHHHDNLTVIDYDPIAVPSHPSARRWLVPLIIACFIAGAFILAAVLSSSDLRPFKIIPLPPPHPRPITLRNLTTLVHPYARLVRLLDTNTPATPLPAVQREFTELCTLERALAIPADVCHDIVDLLDDTSVHLARVLVGIRARAGPGNLVSALRDTVLLMAWGIDTQAQEQQEQEQQQGNGGGGEGVWNSTAEGIFRAVTAQLPNWWDDHNALAVPLQSALESLRQARGMEGDVLGAFKLAVGSLDPNTFPAEDVFYAYDRLFTPLLPRRDALLTTLESATRMLEDAAGRVYEFNATLHEIRAEAKKGTRGGFAFEGLEVVLGRVKDALAVLDYELEAVGVRERQRLRDGEGGEEEAREVEERRPRRRREREERDREERERGRKAWWKL